MLVDPRFRGVFFAPINMLHELAPQCKPISLEEVKRSITEELLSLERQDLQHELQVSISSHFSIFFSYDISFYAKPYF